MILALTWERLYPMRFRLYLILLMTFISFTISAHHVVEQDGYYEVEHSWEYNGKKCSIELNINTELYNYYQIEREHLAYRYQFNGGEIPPNYYSFMLSEHDRPVIRALANEFSNHVATEKGQIQLALTFVQSLPYAYDSATKATDEYLRYPIETLVDGCGDCEDKVALLAALLYEMDVDFILLVLPEHMAVGVHCDGVEADRYLLFHDKQYYYLETTMEGWQMGQIPENYYDAEMEAVPVDAAPCLLFKGVQFESQPTFVFQKATCNLELDLHNLGPGRVTDIKVHVQVIEKGRRSRLLAEEVFSLNDMREGERRTESLWFKSLIKENCILKVEVTGAEVAPLPYQVGLNYSRTSVN